MVINLPFRFECGFDDSETYTAVSKTMADETSPSQQRWEDHCPFVDYNDYDVVWDGKCILFSRVWQCAFLVVDLVSGDQRRRESLVGGAHILKAKKKTDNN